MGSCSGVINAAQETIVMVLELGDKSLLRSPEMLQKILKDEKIWKEIEKVMLAEGKRLAQRQRTGTRVTSDDLKQMGKKVAKSAGNVAKKEAQQQIERSFEYRRVKQSLKQLECSFKRSPVGVFVDENKGWLILVGVGMALGGATAMYMVRSGDVVTTQATKLANKKLRFKVLGNVEVGAKNVKFEPSSRTVEATTFATASWKKVKTKLDLHVAFKDDQLTTTTIRGEVMVKVAKGLKVKGHGKVGYKKPAEFYEPPLLYDIGLGLTYTAGASSTAISVTAMAFATQDQKQRRLGGGAGVNYRISGSGKGVSPSVSAKLSAKGSRVDTFLPNGQVGTQSDVTVGLGIVATF